MSITLAPPARPALSLRRLVATTAAGLAHHVVWSHPALVTAANLAGLPASTVTSGLLWCALAATPEPGDGEG